MNREVKTLCDQAFHRALRSQPYEVSPDSPIYDVVKTFFQKGFAQGGMVGVKLLTDGVLKDIEGLFDGRPSL